MAKFKVVSFNLNGIRARLHQLKELVDKHNPDVIGVQETKVADEQFPKDSVEALGYKVSFHGQKGHYGVALLSKEAPKQIETPIYIDEQCRLIVGRYLLAGKEVTVINGYFPQGDSKSHPVKFPYKQKFYEQCIEYVSTLDVESNLILLGDLNVAPEDIDVGLSESNKKRWLRTGKCSFLPEERAWLEQLNQWGLNDTYKHCAEEERRYSWFDYRSRAFERPEKPGLKIDHIYATPSLFNTVCEVGIDYDIRAMEKSSDHCPVWATFE